jgi:hypothetical protein
MLRISSIALICVAYSIALAFVTHHNVEAPVSEPLYIACAVLSKVGLLGELQLLSRCAHRATLQCSMQVSNCYSQQFKVHTDVTRTDQ